MELCMTLDSALQIVVPEAWSPVLPSLGLFIVSFCMFPITLSIELLQLFWSKENC